MCVGLLHACLYVYCLHPWYPQRSEEVVGSCLIRVKNGFELPSGCWGPNLGPLQKQQLLLTAELSLQPYIHLLKTQRPESWVEEKK